MEFELVDQVPPSYRRSRYDWHSVVEAAKADPTSWVRVPNINAGVAHHIRNGKNSAFREGTWDVQARREDDTLPAGRVTLYIQYVPEGANA